MVDCIVKALVKLELRYVVGNGRSGGIARKSVVAYFYVCENSTYEGEKD